MDGGRSRDDGNNEEKERGCVEVQSTSQGDGEDDKNMEKDVGRCMTQQVDVDSDEDMEKYARSRHESECKEGQSPS